MTDRKQALKNFVLGRPRWQSVLKWVGFYFLAQIIGGCTVGFAVPYFFGSKSSTLDSALGFHLDSAVSAAVLLAMIVYALVRRRRQRRLAAEAALLHVVKARRARPLEPAGRD